MSMLEAYLDETGTDFAGAVCSIAGFLATTEQWALLRADWNIICSADPQTPDFHAYDAWNARGQYWGAGQNPDLTLDQLLARRDSRFQELAEAICARCEVAVSVTMDIASYQRAFAVGFSPKEQKSIPYLLLFWHLQLALAKWMVEQNRWEPIRFVFDDFSSLGRRVARFHPFMLNGVQVPAAVLVLQLPPTFAHDTAEPALKCADLYAYLLQRYINALAKRAPGETYAYQHPALAMMRDRMPHLGQILVDEDLVDLAPLLRDLLDAEKADWAVVHGRP